MVGFGSAVGGTVGEGSTEGEGDEGAEVGLGDAPGGAGDAPPPVHATMTTASVSAARLDVRVFMVIETIRHGSWFRNPPMSPARCATLHPMVMTLRGCRRLLTPLQFATPLQRELMA